MANAELQSGDSQKRSDDAIDLLRREILRGVEDVEQGRFSIFQTDAELDELSDRIILKSSLTRSSSTKMTGR
ncbi:MAG: hypothetical protein ACRD82_20915 [Blastocatellia bacterium]